MFFFSLFLFLYCYFFWIWSDRRRIGLYRKIGSKYPAVPVLGHGYLYMGNREQVLQNMFKLGDHALANGGITATWILHRFYLVLADTLDAEYVLRHFQEKDDMMAVVRLLTRTSSLFATAPVWRPRRKIVTALLSYKNVSKFEPVFVKGSQILVDQLRPLAGKEAFSIWDHLNAYTLDATCNTILGVDFKSQTNHDAPLRTSINTMLDLAGELVLKVWYQVEFIMKRTNFYKIFLKNNEVIKDHIKKAMKKHSEEVLKENEKFVLDEEKQFSLLHLFSQLKEQRGFDETMLHDESLGLLMAASDSTSIGIALVSLILARQPEVQEKVYQELKEVFGDFNRPVEMADLPRLKYLEAVIKETERLYPPAPHVTRKPPEDTVLPSGVKVPKGTSFIISIYALNRNPKYWGPDAHEFRPERFLDGSVPENSYFVFGRGPRKCPGVQFSMMSTKTVLATMLRQYRLLPAGAPDAPLRFLFGITMKEVDNFQIRIQARNTVN